MDNCNYENSNAQKTDSTVDYNELKRQLGILNLSIDTIYVIVVAIVFNILYLDNQRNTLLDSINGTNYTKNGPDLSKIPRITNYMVVYATGMFLLINGSEYERQLSMTGENRNEKSICKTWKSVMSSVLVLLASLIGSNNLEV